MRMQLGRLEMVRNVLTIRWESALIDIKPSRDITDSLMSCMVSAVHQSTVFLLDCSTRNVNYLYVAAFCMMAERMAHSNGSLCLFFVDSQK